ncbi:probable ubiquitin-conjugating enzyme E2 37 [Tanacetum coccineum]
MVQAGRLNLMIQGLEGTVYEKGVFKIDIQIPERYPFQPPVVTFGVFGTVGLSAKAHHKKTKKVSNALIQLGKSAETALEPEYAAAAIEPKAKGVDWLLNGL